jgi:hypothetical protein
MNSSVTTGTHYSRLATHHSRLTQDGSRIPSTSPRARRLLLLANSPSLLARRCASASPRRHWSLHRCLTRRRGASFEPFLGCFGWNPSLKLPTTNVCSRFDWKCESFVPLRCGSLTTKWCGARWELSMTLCAGINYSRGCRPSPLIARS